MLIENLYKVTEKLEITQEQNMTNKVNIQFLNKQLELMKMCGRVNNNPSLAQNENFRLLVMKCRGITPTRDNTRPGDSKSVEYQCIKSKAETEIYLGEKSIKKLILN